MTVRRPVVRVGGRDQQLPVGDVLAIDQWAVMPIGLPFPLWPHLAGVAAPPTGNTHYRYIKLTASDSYNNGVLASESVNGSAPLVQATAVISDSGSPLNGRTVHLVNTERRVVRAGASGVLEADAMQGHAHPTNAARMGSVTVAAGSYTPAPSGGASVSPPSSDGVNGAPRVENETRVKSIGADYYMRIR